MFPDRLALAKAFKAELAAGEVKVGAFLKIPSPDMVEVLALAGLDFVVADAEHGPISPETCQQMVRAADAVGIPLLARVGECESAATLCRFLDTGVSGLHFPRVYSPAVARQLFQNAAYPPAGVRGLAGGRWAGYGRKTSLPALAEEMWPSLIKVIQIEDAEALANLDSLLELDEPDVFFVGPTDLASSMGLFGDSSNPRVIEAVQDVVSRVTARHRTVGIIATTPDQAGANVQLGAKYIMLNGESIVAWGAADALRAVTESKELNR